VDRITTVEMHTGGEPVRIITGGYPMVVGATLLILIALGHQAIRGRRKLAGDSVPRGERRDERWS